jgi:hypothetical protein
VLDPIKTFITNYGNLHNGILTELKNKQNELSLGYLELEKHKQLYVGISEKMEKMER